MSSYDRTKEIGFHPYFRGGISRWLWRFYMYRVTAPACWFIGLTFLFLLFGATSIDLYVFIPFLYAFGIWVVASFVAFFLPPKASVEYYTPARVAAGALAPIKVSVTSLKKSPLVELVVIPMRLPPSIDSAPMQGVSIPLLLPNKPFVTQMGLICHSRGVYDLKGFRIESSFPLGLLRGYTCCWKLSQILVYPTFQPLNNIELPAGKRYQPGGVALASRLGESMEFIGNRDYRDGDNVRDIDWKATARLTKPIVREYREEYFYRVGVIQDTYVPKGNSSRADDFERAISICAAVADYMARKEYIVDLFAAGPNLYHLTAGRNLAFQDQILDILACLGPSKSEPFEIIEPALLESLTQLTTVICVLLDWDEIRRDFVDRIREITEIKVIVVRNGSCTIDPSFDSANVSIIHIGKQAFDNGVGSL